MVITQRYETDYAGIHQRFGNALIAWRFSLAQFTTVQKSILKAGKEEDLIGTFVWESEDYI